MLRRCARRRPPRSPGRRRKLQERATEPSWAGEAGADRSGPTTGGLWSEPGRTELMEATSAPLEGAALGTPAPGFEVLSNDLNGKEVGYVVRLWIPKIGAAGESKDLINYDDRGVSKEDTVEVKAPTEAQDKRMVRVARSTLQELEEPDSETCFGLPNAATAAGFATSGAVLQVAGAGAKAKAKPKPKAASRASNPQVMASKARKTTLKNFNALSININSALSGAQKMLAEAEEKFGTEVLSCDTSVQVIRRRYDLLKKLAASDRVRATDEMSAALLQEANQDPFFQEQAWSCVQTLGQLEYNRFYLLDLQRTVEAVEQLAQQHADCIDVLGCIAAALKSECFQWKASAAALSKARDLEAKALQKEEEREMRRLKATEEKEKRKLEQQLAKQAAAEAKLAAKQDAPAEAAAAKESRGKRRRKNVAVGMLEHDPLIIQAAASGNWPARLDMQFEDSVEDLVGAIKRTGAMTACVARCRRAAIRKVLSATPDVDATGAAHASKKLSKDLAQWTAAFEEKIKSQPATDRSARLIEAPAGILSLDDLLYDKMSQQDKRLQFLNRERLELRFAEAGHDDNARQRNRLRISGAALIASAASSVYAGFLPAGLPSVQYQVAGERLIVVIDILDALQWFHAATKISPTDVPSLQDVIQFLMAQEPLEHVEDAEAAELLSQVQSMRSTLLLPGDVLYVPTCSLIVEKSLPAQHNYGVRATCTFVNSRCYELYRFYRTVYSGDFSAEIMSIELNKLTFSSTVQLTDLQEAPEEDKDPEAITNSEAAAEAEKGQNRPPAGRPTANLQECRDLYDEDENVCRSHLMDMPPELFWLHIKAAKDHPIFDAYWKSVIEEVGEDPEWKFGDEDSDVLEDLLGFIKFLPSGCNGNGQPAAYAVASAAAALVPDELQFQAVENIKTPGVKHNDAAEAVLNIKIPAEIKEKDAAEAAETFQILEDVSMEAVHNIKTPAEVKEKDAAEAAETVQIPEDVNTEAVQNKIPADVQEKEAAEAAETVQIPEDVNTEAVHNIKIPAEVKEKDAAEAAETIQIPEDVNTEAVQNKIPAEVKEAAEAAETVQILEDVSTEAVQNKTPADVQDPGPSMLAIADVAKDESTTPKHQAPPLPHLLKMLGATAEEPTTTPTAAAKAKAKAKPLPKPAAGQKRKKDEAPSKRGATRKK